MIRIDQRSLVHLDDQRLSTMWQQKAFTKMLGLRHKICYCQGATNNAADALSHRIHPTQQANAMTFCQPTWIEDIRLSYDTNAHAQKLPKEFSQRPDPKKRFSVSDGLLYFHNRLWLGGSQTLQHRILRAFHDSTVGSHSGFPVTYRRVRRLFAWPKMKDTIQQYVRTCSVCQQAKPE